MVKGKSTSLSQFYRLGGKVMGMIFKHSTEAQPPEPREVEEEFWKLVIERDSHVVVHQGNAIIYVKDVANCGFSLVAYYLGCVLNLPHNQRRNHATKEKTSSGALYC